MKLRPRLLPQVLHPYDDALVVAGQVTLALEQLAQAEANARAPLDAILVPVSGGGMLAGVAVAAAARGGGAVKVHAVEPEGKALGAALAAGARVLDPALEHVALPTVCDAMPTRCLEAGRWVF